MPEIRYDHAAAPIAMIVLAHGAGAPMDSPFMEKMVSLLVARNLSVARFEFSYMSARRTGGKKRPAPKAETLIPEYVDALAAVISDVPRFIGGKSMGGRIATMMADQAYGQGEIAGAVCLGYPFHPPNTPEKPRTAHLIGLTAPLLIVQGERDPFGPADEVTGFMLSPAIRIVWAPDGDHDLGPRGASGHTRKGNMTFAADAIATFVAENLATSSPG